MKSISYTVTENRITTNSMNRNEIYAELYPLYGKFSIEYENMMNYAKKAIAFAIAGPTDIKCQSMIYILLDKEGATAIIRKFRAMLFLIFKPNSIEFKLCDNLFKKTKEIISYRNNLVHAL